jgi:ribonuclease-3
MINKKEHLLEFCKNVGIKFKNLELLDNAFYHRSIQNEVHNVKSNERLEFLGDSVLGFATASYLYKNFDNPEGELAKIKSAVVSEKTLASIAKKIGIDKLLVLGKGEKLSGGSEKPALLADCMEAIIGAYYLDSGYANAEKYVLSFIVPEIELICKEGMKDYKTLLQEEVQKIYKVFPKYEVIKKSGPDHNQTFEVVVQISDFVLGPEKGKSKKEAEQKVAKKALDFLKKGQI